MSTRTKMVDRNVHTGEKLQSKQNSDSYRSNYDLIFKKKPAPVFIESDADNSLRFSVEDFKTAVDLGHLRTPGMANCLSEHAGVGFYGQGSMESDVDCFSEKPEWADCVYWYWLHK